jgi:hypothetical protein
MTPKDAKEYERLWGEFRDAMNLKVEMLLTNGEDSKEFKKADEKAAQIWRQMGKLRGEPKGYWKS